MRLQLRFYAYRGDNLRAYAGICYWWQAQITLHGADWQFGLVDTALKRKASQPPEHLVLRPWSERQRPLNLRLGTPDVCSFTTNLFFGNRAYALDWRSESGGTAAKYRVTFKEQAPRLGDLNVTGANLHRLILTGSRGTDMTLLLDQPQGTLKVPIGSYSLDEIWLRRGEFEALRPNAGKVRVEEERPAALIAGGPLTNSVSLSSAGPNLQINHRLLGANGGIYKVPRPDYEHPPQFAVFQGTNRLGTGKFKFG